MVYYLAIDLGTTAVNGRRWWKTGSREGVHSSAAECLAVYGYCGGNQKKAQKWLSGKTLPLRITTDEEGSGVYLISDSGYAARMDRNDRP